VSEGWLKELAIRNTALYRFGWFTLALFFLAVMMFFIDPTEIKGINAWIKPMKFGLSITIYVWTFAWLLGYSANLRANRIISTGIIVTMAVEIVLIYFQAFRGTASHFNNSSLFDGVVFAIMGVFILINTFINAYAVWVFFRREVSLQAPLLWAWRAGLVLLLLGSISGQWMVIQLAHTVGAPDGGPGLPFVNWSTVAGDIRSAHFFTLHGLQVIPIATLLLIRYTGSSASRWVIATIAVYTSWCILLHLRALQGLPLLSLPG
jgi:hypothetical protein